MANTLMNYLIPSDMEQYMSFYGMHFNKKLCDFAVDKMEKEDKATGIMKKITPMKLEELKPILEKYKIEIESNDWYDALYLANMVKSDFWGSSIEDEEHLAKYVGDVLCDPDGYEGIVFSRFLADCSAKGCVIFWDMMVQRLMESAYLDVDSRWGVLVCYNYDTLDYDDIWAICKSFGMSDKSINKALRILSSYNTGMTVSSNDLRMSAIFISKATSPSEWWSSCLHELRHAAQAIIEYYGADWGEDDAYLTGFLTKQVVEKIAEPCR